MKRIVYGFLLLVLYPIFPATAATDRELRSIITNSWIMTAHKPEAEVLQVTRYEKDGTFKTTYFLTYKNGGRSSDGFDVSGDWRIRNGIFTESVKESMAPNQIPVGLVLKRTFDSASPEKLVLRAADGIKIAEMFPLTKPGNSFPQVKSMP